MVPEEDVRATGTAHPSRDVSDQWSLNRAGVGRLGGPRVSGELFAFDDPEERLPVLDRLEGFDPGGPSLYRRVLIPVETSDGGAVLAWVYVIERSSGTYLPGGRWPP